MNQDQMIALASASAALLSAFWAWRSHSIAKSAFELAQRANDAQQGAVGCYLAEIRSSRSSAGNRQIYAALTYTNQSHLEDTIVRLELVVSYLTDGLQMNLVLAPVTPDKASRNFEHFAFVKLPCHIPARGAISLWVCFQLPSSLSSDKRIDQYSFEAVLASGAKTDAISRIAPEIIDAD